MRNRDLVINKLEYLEIHLKTLRGIVQRNEPVEKYYNTISTTEEIVGEIKSAIEREDMSSNELNRN